MFASQFKSIMKKQQIVNLLQQNLGQLIEMDVQRLAVFGSVARDEATEQSDVDILVAFAHSTTFDKYMKLLFFLEDLVGRPVDLVTEQAIRTQLKPTIERDAIYVA